MPFIPRLESLGFSGIPYKEKAGLSDQEKTQLSKARQTLQKIELDGSSGIHNYQSIEEALTNLKNTVNSLGKSIKKPDG
jgi:hypothetical protein